MFKNILSLPDGTIASWRLSDPPAYFRRPGYQVELSVDQFPHKFEWDTRVHVYLADEEYGKGGPLTESNDPAKLAHAQAMLEKWVADPVHLRILYVCADTGDTTHIVVSGGRAMSYITPWYSHGNDKLARTGYVRTYSDGRTSKCETSVNLLCAAHAQLFVMLHAVGVRNWLSQGSNFDGAKDPLEGFTDAAVCLAKVTCSRRTQIISCDEESAQGYFNDFGVPSYSTSDRRYGPQWYLWDHGERIILVWCEDEGVANVAVWEAEPAPNGLDYHNEFEGEYTDKFFHEIYVPQQGE